MIGKETEKFNKKIKSNMIINYVTKVIGILITFINIRVLVNYLGTENYGWWTTLLSIVSWISIGDFGIGNGLRNKLSETLVKKDYYRAKRYISTAYYYLSIIALFIIGIGLIVSLVILNNGKIDNEKIFAIMIIIVGIGINFVLNIIGSILYANNESASVAITGLIWNLVYIIFILVLKILNMTKVKLIYISIAYIISLIIANLIATIRFYSKNSSLIPKKKYIDISLSKDIIGLGGKFFVLQIAGIILFSTDNLIISKLINYEKVTYYDLITKIFNNLNNFYSILLIPIWSATTHAFTIKNYKWIKKTSLKLHLLLIPFITVIFILSIFMNKIIYIWLGNSNISYKNLEIFIFAIYSINAAWLGIYCSFLNGMGKIEIQMYLAILGAIINIPLSIYFAKYLNLGIVGIKLATLSTQVLQSIILPIQYYITINREERKIN